MDIRTIFRAMAVIALFAGLWSIHDAVAAEFAATGNTPPRREGPNTADTDSEDPFADLLKEQPVQVIKTGPTCEFVRIQLPPGVTLDDIPGFAAPRRSPNHYTRHLGRLD